MSNANQYLRHLAGSIGPRPTSSDTERVAAEWVYETMQAHGLQAQIQDFETPRSSLLATATVHATFVLALVLIYVAASVTWLAWLIWAVLVAVAACTFLTARGRTCPSVLMPKGPSQNVVARWAPHASSGERRRKIVVVAGLDTAPISPLSPVAGGTLLRSLKRYTRYYLYVAPLLALVFTLPVKALAPAEVWVWAAMLVGALAPLAVAVDAAATPLVKRYSPGANANASGVAAMLSVLDLLVGESPAAMAAGETGRVATSGDIAGLAGVGGGQAADVFSDDGWGAGGSSGGIDLPDDFAWASAPGAAPTHQVSEVATSHDSYQTSGSAPASTWGQDDDLDLAPARHAAPSTERRSVAPAAAGDSPTIRGSYTETFETVEFAEVPEDLQQTISFAPVTGQDITPGLSPDAEVLGPDVIGLGKPAEMVTPMDFGERNAKKSLFSFLRKGDAAPKATKPKRGSGRRRGTAPSEDTAESWLGMGDDFSATSAGQDIGSWDNFADDGSGWKGGWAEGDVIEDAEYAGAEAARIRRRVSESSDGSLSDKEVWFVATGASAAGGWGMRSILEEYAADLKGASFINVECVGAGSLHWYSSEGIERDLQPSSRLISVAKRASRELDLKVKGASGSRRWTDAAVVLRARGKAMTVTRLGADGYPVGVGSPADTVDGIDLALIDEAAQLVAQMVRQY